MALNPGSATRESYFSASFSNLKNWDSNSIYIHLVTLLKDSTCHLRQLLSQSLPPGHVLEQREPHE